MAEQNQTTRKQHYIPEMYLKNFANEAGKIWQYNLFYGNYKPVTPAQTGYTEFLYETQWKSSPEGEERFALVNYLENYFSEREKIYDSCISSICKKIVDDTASITEITKNEKAILAEFTTNIVLRHPNMMKLMEFDNFSSAGISDAHINRLKKTFGMDAETVLVFENKCKWLDLRFPGGYFQNVQKMFENMYLSFLVSDNLSFITCDWPIILAQVEGEIIALLLPISPKCCICYSVFKTQNINYVSDEMVVLYNKLHIEKKSTRMKYLYACNKHDIERLFKKARRCWSE